ncbi:MAG: glycosyltransferase family 9 protein [Spirochaetia bacterium]|nr:glycosyltransferase family 9 protein [Spirochaetia bacterium]
MPQNNSRNNQSFKIIVVRFSAMGDVILTKPVLESFIKKYSHIKVYLLSQKTFKPVFQDLTNLTFIEADLKKQHKGIPGLWKLAQELKPYQFSFIIDLHFVLRSVILSFFMKMTSIDLRIFRINKGRSEKRNLTKRFNKIRQPLKHTIERYADVFAKAGLPINTSLPPKPKKFKKKSFGKLKIGIAPLSRHLLKEWPQDFMTQLMNLLSGDFAIDFYILGSPDETNKLKNYASENSAIMAGKLNFTDEIDFIKTLDAVITMDSANMHLAGVFGIPCISIWGPTHPYAGFSPIGKQNLVIQNLNLNCRPCSVFGNKPCYRKDHACMMELTPNQIYKEVKSFILKLRA